MNTFGNIFRFTTFGESHGPAIGGVIDGMPAGLTIDLDAVAAMMRRRRPGQSAVTTSREEPDAVTILSGLFEGKTTGAPIGFLIENTDHRSADYDNLRHLYRPSHADYAWQMKYGIRDHRGGGRSSARETAARVVAGAFALQALATLGITVRAYTSQIGDIALPEVYTPVDPESNDVRCPDAATADRMRSLVISVRDEGDTIGGVVTCRVDGLPAGLGEPVYGKLSAMLGSAMLSINACKGVEFGMGFDGCRLRGSQVADTPIASTDGGVAGFASNHSGGIQGGVSNGAPVVMRVAFKPVATLRRPVATVDDRGRAATLEARGRHDPCVVPRAVPVVEAMAACVVLDAWLLNLSARL